MMNNVNNRVGLQHPFVVKLAAAFQTEEKLYMCLEYVEGGELFVHLRRYSSTIWKRTGTFLTGVILQIWLLP